MWSNSKRSDFRKSFITGDLILYVESSGQKVGDPLHQETPEMKPSISRHQNFFQTNFGAYNKFNSKCL